MKTRTRWPVRSAAALLAVSASFAAASLAAAQEKEVVLGQSAGYTGRSASSVKELIDGARLWFDALNRKGGVHGAKIYLNTLDDGYFPDLAVKNTRQLIDEDKVLALFGYYGDESVKGVLPVLAEKRVPMIAPVSGSSALRIPPNPYVFNLRAGYQAEVEKVVAQITAMGMNRIGVFYQSDELGRDVLTGLEKSLQSRKLAIAGQGAYERNTVKVDEAVAKVAAGQPQAILMACTLEACVEFVKQMRKRGAAPQFLHLSTVEAAALIKELGEAGARGLTVTQVVPLPTDHQKPVVREYNKLLAEAGGKNKPSFAGLEGFIAAKVVTEGLKKAGPNPTRERLIAALESLGTFDVGGFAVHYGPGNHRGADYVDITIIGRGGTTRY
jgi:ABC-type branched-subunit amino acid transport system substrate-binding protein